MSIFAVTSGKGGAGKSCLAAYTAAALALTGKRVLLVEAGFGYRSLDLILGAAGDVLFDTADVLAERCEAAKAIVQTPYHSNLFLMPGPSTPHNSPPEPEALTTLLRGAKAHFDYVIADGIDFRLVSPEVFQAILLVVTPDSLSIRMETAHAAALHKAGATLRLVINNVPAKILPLYNARDFDDIIDLTAAQLTGVIPHSPILQYSSHAGEPIPKSSLTVDIFDNIAARLLGERRKLLIR